MVFIGISLLVICTILNMVFPEIINVDNNLTFLEALLISGFVFGFCLPIWAVVYESDNYVEARKH